MICSELEPYFCKDYDFKNNLLSAWAGIRPLVKADPNPNVAVSDKSFMVKGF